jgi:hypothetical protein
VTNRATGQPVDSRMWVEVLAENPFVDKYPPFMHAASASQDKFETDIDGKFRIVTIPGPVLLMAGPRKGNWGDYKPPVPDPKHKGLFQNEAGVLGYFGYGGSQGLVQGNWCRVIEAKATDTELSVNVELEPATRTPLKVVEADGKPLAGLSVRLYFTRRAAEEAFAVLTADQFPITDADGEFRIDHLFPGEEFKLHYHRGQKRLGPYIAKIPNHKATKHGGTLKLGDVKLEPSKGEE